MADTCGVCPRSVPNVGATLLLASVVMLSSYVPAVPASRVDPAPALKE